MNASAESFNPQAVPAPAAASAASELSPDDIKRAYYGPDQQAAAGDAVAQVQLICEAHNLPLSFNWDTEQPLPEGYGVGIIPLAQRREDVGTVTIGAAIFGIPDPQLCMAHERGESWARSVLEAALLTKAANSVRQAIRNEDGPLSLPFSVDDFITSVRTDNGLAFFRAHVGDMVKGINKMLNRKIMNAALLRQILASAKFAEQQFPTIAQDRWEKVIDVMLGLAAKAGEDPGIVAVWRKTRNETELSINDFGIDDIEETFASLA